MNNKVIEAIEAFTNLDDRSASISKIKRKLETLQAEYLRCDINKSLNPVKKKSILNELSIEIRNTKRRLNDLQFKQKIVTPRTQRIAYFFNDDYDEIATESYTSGYNDAFDEIRNII